MKSYKVSILCNGQVKEVSVELEDDLLWTIVVSSAMSGCYDRECETDEMFLRRIFSTRFTVLLVESFDK